MSTPREAQLELFRLAERVVADVMRRRGGTERREVGDIDAELGRIVDEYLDQLPERARGGAHAAAVRGGFQVMWDGLAYFVQARVRRTGTPETDQGAVAWFVAGLHQVERNVREPWQGVNEDDTVEQRLARGEGPLSDEKILELQTLAGRRLVDAVRRYTRDRQQGRPQPLFPGQNPEALIAQEPLGGPRPPRGSLFQIQGLLEERLRRIPEDWWWSPEGRDEIAWRLSEVVERIPLAQELIRELRELIDRLTRPRPDLEHDAYILTFVLPLMRDLSYKFDQSWVLGLSAEGGLQHKVDFLTLFRFRRDEVEEALRFSNRLFPAGGLGGREEEALVPGRPEERATAAQLAARAVLANLERAGLATGAGVSVANMIIARRIPPLDDRAAVRAAELQGIRRALTAARITGARRDITARDIGLRLPPPEV